MIAVNPVYLLTLAQPTPNLLGSLVVLWTVWRTCMPEGYCVKCKAKKEIADAVEELMKNGRKAIKGKCPTCGVVMFKILGGKAAAPAAPAPATPAGVPPAA